MRVWFQTEGGFAYFPGLAKPVEIDTAKLPEEQAKTIAQLIEESAFFDLPAVVGSLPAGAADCHIYTLTIEAAGRRHTVRATDPIPDDLQELIEQLRKTTRAMRAAARKRSEV